MTIVGPGARGAGPRLYRWMRLAALGIIGGMAIANVIWSVQTWPMGDLEAYWAAGERIRAGEALYPGEPPFRAYRYAPWFAWLWAGLTYLPYHVVAVLWEGALITATLAASVPFVRRGLVGLATAALLVPLLFAVSAGGNVMPLLVVSLLYGLDRPSGPLWIAIAASLRATPILFAAVYVARRQWRRFWATIVLTAALLLPMLGYNPETLLTDVAGGVPGLYELSRLVYAVVVLASIAVLVVMAITRSRYVALCAATASVLTLPRLLVYDVASLLMVHPDSERRDASRGESARSVCDR